MNTVKNCYSAPGMPYHAPRSFRYEEDCPICRYGTLAFEKESEGRIKLCIDCGAKFKNENGKWIRDLKTL